MKILAIIKWVIRIILFVLLLVLIFDNMQHVTFNLFGVYALKLPLIILTLIFVALGILIGLVASMPRKFFLKAKIKTLEQELMKLTETKKKEEIN